MKKFYSTLAAVTICATAFAANPFTTETYNFGETSTVAKFQTENVARPAKAAAKAAQVKDAAELAGTYGMQALIAQNQQTMLGTVTGVSIEHKAGNTVNVSLLSYGGATFEGEFDATKQTVKIPYGQKAEVYFSQTEKGYITLYEYLFDTNDANKDGVTFTVNGDTKELEYIPTVNAENYYEGTLLLGIAEATPGTKIFFQLFDTWIRPANSAMSYCFYDETSNSLTEPIIDYINVYNKNGNVAIDGFFCRFENTIELTVDAEAQTATATDQLVFTDRQLGELYLWGFNEQGQADGKNVTFNTQYDQEGGMYFTNDAVGVINNDGTQGVILYQVQMLIPYNPFDPSSIENVAIDNDANAPVEYFNLQGVRVANPEAGQLVIKRQGSKVEKMIAR